MTKQVLFISHDASRTGAPIVLLNFLKWFKENSNIPFQILLKNGGELEEEFRAIAPITVLRKKEFSVLKRTFIKANRIFGLKFSPSQEVTSGRSREITRKLKQGLKGDIRLIYSNTITNGQTLELLNKTYQCPIVSHIHELEWMIRKFATEVERTKKYTNHYIACSQAVKQNLVQNHDIERQQISVFHSFIPNSNLQPKQLKRLELCEQLGIPNTSFLVGASGTIDWRKGSDLFVQLSSIIQKRNCDLSIHFIWLGGNLKSSYFTQINHDIMHMNLEDRIHFIGTKTNPLDYFSAFDVFSLMSREDPFPLVCLEAASVGTPIVCFNDAGGMKELVEDDCGFVVPYLDLEAMAGKIIEILLDSNLRQLLGNQASKKVREKYTLEVIAPKILELIEGIINKT